MEIVKMSLEIGSRMKNLMHRLNSNKISTISQPQKSKMKVYLRCLRNIELRAAHFSEIY